MQPQADGVSLREHLIAARAAGADPKELHVPELPEAMSYLWSVFAELRSSKTASEPLSFPDLQAYGELMGVGLLPWEVEILRRLDYHWLKARSDNG